MFDVDFSELAVVGVVALLVVGPKDLPRLLRTVGHWVGRARGMARHLRAGFDTMVREAEIEEMNRRWEQQNREIMAASRVDSWIDPTDRPVMTALPGGESVQPPLPPEVDPVHYQPIPAATPAAPADKPAPPPAGQLA